MKLSDINAVNNINNWRESLCETAKQLASGDYQVSVWIGDGQYVIDKNDPLRDDIKNWFQDQILGAESELIKLGVNVEDA